MVGVSYDITELILSVGKDLKPVEFTLCQVAYSTVDGKDGACEGIGKEEGDHHSDHQHDDPDNDDYHERSYNMGTEEGNSQIILDFYSEADYLTIYDGVGTAGPVLVPRRLIQDDMVIPFHFTKGAVTVVIESSGTSTWKYEVSCP